MWELSMHVVYTVPVADEMEQQIDVMDHRRELSVAAKVSAVNR